MANPKRRHSKARTRKRRAHDALPRVGVSICPNCHAAIGTFHSTDIGAHLMRMEEKITRLRKRLDTMDDAFMHWAKTGEVTHRIPRPA